MAKFLTEVASSGDAARGEVIFRRKEMNCLKCHAIAGAGGQVGPGLESIGASAPADYLVDSLLEPGKAVKENYHATVVATDDGKLLTGIRVRQTDTELVLRDADDREVSIPSSSIEEQKPGGSLMPAGLTDTLTRGELADLVRFLSELGKIGPYAVTKERVFRRWQVLEPGRDASTALIRTSLDAVAESSGSLVWSPAYTTVAGTLPAGGTPVGLPGEGRTRDHDGPVPGGGLQPGQIPARFQLGPRPDALDRRASHRAGRLGPGGTDRRTGTRHSHLDHRLRTGSTPRGDPMYARGCGRIGWSGAGGPGQVRAAHVDSRTTSPDDRRPRPVDGRDSCPQACPVCGGRLVEQRGKLICSRCRTICETCCEGGTGMDRRTCERRGITPSLASQ